MLSTGLFTIELFHPAGDSDGATPYTFTSLPAALQVARYRHTATRIANDWVLIVGGPTTPTTELFDPLARSFMAAEDTPTIVDPNGTTEPPGRVDHRATPLNDNGVLITGGVSQEDLEPVFSSAIVYRATNGASCGFGGECFSGYCADNVCCDNACGTCGSCQTGTCEYIAAGAPCPGQEAYACQGDSLACPGLCLDDTQCSIHYTCQSHQCVPVAKCRSTVDCVDGGRCNEDGACVSDESPLPATGGCDCRSARGGRDGRAWVHTLALLSAMAALGARRRRQKRDPTETFGTHTKNLP
jgi:MYXO-CTERM domain-containing protein